MVPSISMGAPLADASVSLQLIQDHMDMGVINTLCSTHVNNSSDLYAALNNDPALSNANSRVERVYPTQVGAAYREHAGTNDDSSWNFGNISNSFLGGVNNAYRDDLPHVDGDFDVSGIPCYGTVFSSLPLRNDLNVISMSDLTYFAENDPPWNYDSILVEKANANTPRSTRTTTTTGSVVTPSPSMQSIAFTNGMYGGASYATLPTQGNPAAYETLAPADKGGALNDVSRLHEALLLDPDCSSHGGLKPDGDVFMVSEFPRSMNEGVMRDMFNLASSTSPLQLMLIKAKNLGEKLVSEFKEFGDPDPSSKAIEVLKTALAMLGYSLESRSDSENLLQGVGGPHFSAPTMLAHPDEFKNPSSFLKIYGDPLCGSGPNSNQNPLKGQNGNWLCSECGNINFPRRFRCNKCTSQRGEEGDKTVTDYAKGVYHQHLRSYKQLTPNNKNNCKIPDNESNLSSVLVNPVDGNSPLFTRDSKYKKFEKNSNENASGSGSRPKASNMSRPFKQYRNKR